MQVLATEWRLALVKEKERKSHGQEDDCGKGGTRGPAPLRRYQSPDRYAMQEPRYGQWGKVPLPWRARRPKTDTWKIQRRIEKAC